MWQTPENDQFAEEIYLAGERVPAGIYHLLGSHRSVSLECEDTLPASLDGRVACYVVVRAWAGSPSAQIRAPYDAAAASAFTDDAIPLEAA